MKLIYANETKRVPMATSYKHLVELSTAAFNLTKEVRFYYVDSDGDIITVSSENDFEEAKQVAPDRMIIAQNIDQAKESLGISNMQRSEILSQSMMSASLMNPEGQPHYGGYGQFRGIPGNQVLQSILQNTGGMRPSMDPLFNKMRASQMQSDINGMNTSRSRLTSFDMSEINHPFAMQQQQLPLDQNGYNTERLNYNQQPDQLQQVRENMETNFKKFKESVHSNEDKLQNLKPEHEENKLINDIVKDMEENYKKVEVIKPRSEVKPEPIILAEKSEVVRPASPVEELKEKEKPLSCYKCDGTGKLQDKECPKCEGKGVLEGEFYKAMNEFIRSEMKAYCTNEYKKLLGKDIYAKELTQSEVIHHGATCQMCKMNPIRGIRYHILQEKGFDLCKACEKKWDKKSPVYKIRSNEQFKELPISANVLASQEEKSYVSSHDKVDEKSGISAKEDSNSRFSLIEKPKSGSIVENPYINVSQQQLNPVSVGQFNSQCLNKADFKDLKYYCGSAFLLQWTFKNTSEGGKDWPAAVVFKQIAGDEFGVQPFKINKSILNGNTMDLFVNFKAPAEPGTYHGFFRLCYGPGDIEFGEKVWIDLNVEDSNKEQIKKVEEAQPKEEQVVKQVSFEPENEKEKIKDNLMNIMMEMKEDQKYIDLAKEKERFVISSEPKPEEVASPRKDIQQKNQWEMLGQNLKESQINYKANQPDQVHVSEIIDPMVRSQQMLEKLNNINLVNSEDESSQIEIDAMSSPSIKIMAEDILSKNNSIPQVNLEEDPDKEMASMISNNKHHSVMEKSNSLQQPQNDDRDLSTALSPEESKGPKIEQQLPQEVRPDVLAPQEDQAKIAYVEQMHKYTLSDEIRQNLLQLMGMGCMDLNKNLKVLQECGNDIDKACIKIMGLSEN